MLHRSLTIQRNAEKPGRMVKKIEPYTPNTLSTNAWRQVTPYLCDSRKIAACGEQHPLVFSRLKTVRVDNSFNISSDMYPLVWWCGGGAVCIPATMVAHSLPARDATVFCRSRDRGHSCVPSVPPARSWTTCARSGAKVHVGVQMERGT